LLVKPGPHTVMSPTLMNPLQHPLNAGTQAAVYKPSKWF